jgi:hypothetical protein
MEVKRLESGALGIDSSRRVITPGSSAGNYGFLVARSLHANTPVGGKQRSSGELLGSGKSARFGRGRLPRQLRSNLRFRKEDYVHGHSTKTSRAEPISIPRTPGTASIFSPNPSVCSTSVMWPNGWESAKDGYGTRLQVADNRGCSR